jgi:L-amino acid N-acyltransferase YncA
MSTMMRLVTEADAPRILDIYAPIVRETVISFEYEVPGEDEMRQRIRGKLEHGYPWIVMERDDLLLGYAYAGRWRDRAAYDWTVETTVYVNASARRGGIGRTLYGALFEVLRLQGFVQAVAGVTLPNDASVGLHQAVGFVPTGTTHNAGYKFGHWHGVAFFEMTLQTPPDVPTPTRNVASLVGTEDWQSIVEN